jgi:hypothetical protein
MKTFFAVFGVIFLILLLMVLGGVGFGLVAMPENPMDAFGFWLLSMRGGVLNNESKAYADTTIPAIVSTWSEKELLDRQSPEFKQTVTPQQVEQIFKRNAALGHLQKCDPAEGQSIMNAMTHTIKAEYYAKAAFEKGEAVIDLSLIKHGDQWQILGLSVKPLAPQATPTPQPQPQPPPQSQ